MWGRNISSPIPLGVGGRKRMERGSYSGARFFGGERVKAPEKGGCTAGIARNNIVACRQGLGRRQKFARD